MLRSFESPGGRSPCAARRPSRFRRDNFRAAEPDWVSRVQPLLTEQTLLVVRVDVQKADPKAVFDWLEQSVPAGEHADFVRRGLAELRGNLVEVRNLLLKAGGREVIVLIGITSGAMPVSMVRVIPVREGADIAGLLNCDQAEKWDSKAMYPPETPVKARLGDAIVFTTAGAMKQLDEARGQTRPGLPDIAPAAGAVADSGVQVLLVMGPDLRRVLEEMAPAATGRALNAPTTVLTRGMSGRRRWARKSRRRGN